ncbi:acylaminoacyl-peptidase [Roseateles sp. YR242]|uniref:S9 family peptidase n=1 Tax=Roseateles sp. YR242 TaxID=1855305 RepID=UPI0008C917C0|nr:prolyl oligopeptidase family serine peptidase [Roseateles sp. YR242]SEK27039.1 acylaminoacyl-peptidase [Roseateles sp. YR242]
MKFETLSMLLGMGIMLTAGSDVHAQSEVLTPRALAEIERLGAPALSRDGQTAAYTVTGERLASSETTSKSTSEPNNKGNGKTSAKLWLAPSADLQSATLLVQTDQAISQLSWSEDGKSVYYVSPASGRAQLWNVGVDATAPRQVTHYPLGVLAYRLVDHDRLLITAHDAFADCADLACNQARLDQEEARKRDRAPAESGLMYRDGEAPRYLDGYIDNRFVNLFQARLSGKEVLGNATAIVQGYRYDIAERNFLPQIDFSVSPDGHALYAGLRPSGSNQGDELPKTIYRAALEAGPSSAGNQYGAWISDPARSVYRPRISPDGRRLAYLRAEGSEHTAPRITIWVRDLATDQDRQVAAGLDVLVSELEWSSGGDSLYAMGPEGTHLRLFKIPLNDAGSSAGDGAGATATADANAIAGAKVPADARAFAAVPSSGSVLQWSSQGGRLALLESHLQQPPEVSVVEEGPAGRRLSSTSSATAQVAPYALGEVSTFRFKGWNRDTVEGMLMKPARFDPARRYPVVLLLHGGPNGHFSDAWSAGMLAPQLLAARGYAVVMINPHGSAGYGTAFGRAVLRHWDDRPLEDFKAGWAHALAAFPFLDPARACAVGGSYGGYLTLLFAGRWKAPWKCYVNGQGIFDVRSFFYANDITRYDQLSFGQEPWAAADLERQNPARDVGQWTQPIFTIAGGRDYRVPIEQTLGAYKASALRKVPSQLLLFPDESHGQFNLPNRIRTMDEVLSWLDRWTAPGGQAEARVR